MQGTGAALDAASDVNDASHVSSGVLKEVVVARRRVLAIGLDGFDVAFADQLIASGDLPTLRAFRDRSARFLLDHGAAARTGLAWEHFASGLTPEAGGRAAVVKLEPSTYEVWQEPALFEPFFQQLDVPCVVFDAPYFDLSRAPKVRGVVAWGAHDAGVATTANPSALLTDGDIAAYPVPETMYGSPWPSVAATSAMGAGLVRGLAARAQAASWLLGSRFDDWQLALVVTGESHSAAEAFWHGIDADHPLHDVASAAAAANSMTEVYRATDRFVADVVDAAGADTVVVFSMGGMGPNQSDVPSMVLLPELLLRWACHESLLEVPPEWSSHPRDLPIQPDDVTKSSVSPVWYGASDGIADTARTWLQKLPAPVKRGLRRFRPAPSAAPSKMPPGALRLDWQPATRYRQWWPKMPAFALPSFYDGRVRLNLRGREPTASSTRPTTGVSATTSSSCCASVATRGPVSRCWPRWSGSPVTRSRSRAPTPTW